ncbi:hypothetical protein JDV02_003459 [Purpureocillium takamizusanense]|uniref:Histidine kinase n=1 Tax=Purpureocillium takamizusanense TaxID=2060973 RepID=A0A9Q8QD94_9HYPO|nr:uncharacterized protein JDV02_003459 [Purpureocillium takamizusanense]UNI17081.1 hypothetical protein JDV02_003459 [Purpureocillium takamizusanense]
MRRSTTPAKNGLEADQHQPVAEGAFSRLAEHAPWGMFMAGADGHITYCNKMWRQISRRQADNIDDTATGWMNNIRDGDRQTLEAAWRRLVTNGEALSVDFQFRHDDEGANLSGDSWFRLTASFEKQAEGVPPCILGYLTDITSQKCAENTQAERQARATDLRFQQSSFIDIISHEMRNPLSVVLQCAEQVVNSFSSLETQRDDDRTNEQLRSCLEAATTINLCASHQKRVLDDIIILAKLNANLLSITPVDEHPIKVVEQTLRMLEPDLTSLGIEVKFKLDESFDKYDISEIKMDPPRLQQVLSNLMNKVMESAQGQEKRTITLTMSASKDISDVADQGVFYFERFSKERTGGIHISKDDWGTGEAINIHCLLQDSGPGPTEDQLRALFDTSQPRNRRSHGLQSGSSIGLFIAKILTEMQGGQIGVSRTETGSSNLCFYIQGRKSTRPQGNREHATAAAETGRSTEASTIAPAPGPEGEAPANPALDILIVEDNVISQRVLQKQLRNTGHRARVANHGREALDALQKSRYWVGHEDCGLDVSVILMDLEMPVMDGITCTKRIREYERDGTITKHIPIIGISAYARSEQIKNAKAAGIDDVLPKPFRIQELMPKMDMLMGRRRKFSFSPKV